MFKFLSLFKNPKFVLTLTLLIVIPFITYNLFQLQINNILGVKTQQQPSPQPIISPPPASGSSPTATPETSHFLSPTPLPILSKSTYTIALYGDSMVDTMGENLEYLDTALKVKYPQTQFKLYNFGIGSQNIEQGLNRFSQSFIYQTRNYPPITQIKADVIVLGSFAYNPFSPHDKNKHYTTLLQLINQAKNTGADLYVLAEIAPLKVGFGKGPGGVNWSEEVAAKHVKNIQEQIGNAISLSKGQNVGLINVYQASQDSKYGNAIYVNPNDGIHPSGDGHALTANLIVKTIKLK